MNSIEMLFFHGFLGQPSDWDFAREWLAKTMPSILIRQENLYTSFEQSHFSSLEAWAKFYAKKLQDEPVKRRLLVGYSMGGRAALHLLRAAPTLFEKGILISTHPGLASEQEKMARRKADAIWAKRFLSEEPEVLFRDWNAQNVFKGSKPRIETFLDAFKRKTLAMILETWSLGTQDDFRDFLKMRPLPTVWMVGELDTRYLEILETLPLNLIKTVTICGAGHRLPWDAPGAFLEALENEILIATS